jgi:argininosuccinate lyase
MSQATSPARQSARPILRPSAGPGAAYGIEFPLDLERFDALLGFDAAPWNARDSIRNYDYMIETYMALALTRGRSPAFNRLAKVTKSRAFSRYWR